MSWWSLHWISLWRGQLHTALLLGIPDLMWDELRVYILHLLLSPGGRLSTKCTPHSSLSWFIAPYRAILSFQNIFPTTVQYVNNSKFVEWCFDWDIPTTYSLIPIKCPLDPSISSLRTLKPHVIIQTPYRVQHHLWTEVPQTFEKDLSMVYVCVRADPWGCHLNKKKSPQVSYHVLWPGAECIMV